MKRLLLIVAIVATIVATLCGITAHRLWVDNRRLERNQHALLSDIELYRTKAGESAASVEVLELRIREFDELRARDAEEIRSLGIRLRRAESYAVSASESEAVVEAPITDTIYLHDTVVVPRFVYDDRWLSIVGELQHDSVRLALRSVDTLHQVVHRVPRRFLFFRFGTKAIRQEIWSSNPHTRLVYSEYIDLRK